MGLGNNFIIFQLVLWLLFIFVWCLFPNFLISEWQKKLWLHDIFILSLLELAWTGLDLIKLISCLLWSLCLGKLCTRCAGTPGGHCPWTWNHLMRHQQSNYIHSCFDDAPWAIVIRESVVEKHLNLLTLSVWFYILRCSYLIFCLEELAVSKQLYILSLLTILSKYAQNFNKVKRLLKPFFVFSVSVT